MQETDEAKIPGSRQRGAAHQSEIDALRAVIEQERQALRDAHEQHASQLRAQAASLGETFVAASNLALRGIERAESRLAALELDLQGRMGQLSRDMQSVVEELRSARPQSFPGAPSAFPLESVMRIHEELRESDGTPATGAEALEAGLAAFQGPAPASVRTMPQPMESTTALTARLESLERAIVNASAAAAQPAARSKPVYATAGLIVAVAAFALFSLWMQRRMEARLNDAAVRIAVAERQRDSASELIDSRLTATRDEAARQVASARQAAVEAQVVGNVLAAPDLVRYWLLGGTGSPRPYARLLFSRSRGMVFSASRLPGAGAGKTYQLWMLTKGGPISAGLMAPDNAGRITFATDVPLSVPKRITGSVLTLESTGGGTTPSGTRVLVRVP